MNPDLIKAARAIVAARSKHPDLTSDEVQQIAHSFGQDGEKVAGYLQHLRADHGNLVASALKGITANWGDEIVGMIPSALGGGEAGKEEMRLRYELAALDHPVAAPVIELAGGVGAALATGGIAPEFATGSRIANSALEAGAVGGGYGVVSGTGSGEDAGSRAKGAVREGATGTLLGGVLGSVAGTLAEHTPSGAALRRQLQAINESGGIKALRQKLSEFTAGDRGNLVVGADLSKPMRGLGDYAANQSPTVYSRAADIFEHRQPDITERLLNDVDTHIGSPDAHARASELATGKTDWAKTAYDNLRNSDATFSSEDLSPLLDHPEMQKALRRATLAGDLKPNTEFGDLITRLRAGSRDPKDIAAAAKLANGEGTRELTFADMQDLKQELDDRIRSAYSNGRGNLADAYKTIRTNVRDLIVSKVPDYAAVDAEYAAKSRLQEALTQGQDMWSKIGVRQLQADMAKLSPADADEFRLGLASKLVDSLRDVSTNRNVAKQLLDKGISTQEKLKVIFGDEATFDNFMSRVKLEKDMFDTRSTVGGSATAKRVADTGFDPLPMLSGAFYGPHAAAAGAVRTVFRGFRRRNTHIADQVGELAFTQGADKIAALLDRLEQPISLLGHKNAVRIGQGTAIVAPHILSLFDSRE